MDDIDIHWWMVKASGLLVEYLRDIRDIKKNVNELFQHIYAYGYSSNINMRKVIFLFLEVSLMQVACTVVRRSEYFRDMNNLHLRVLAFNVRNFISSFKYFFKVILCWQYIGVLSVVKNSDGNYSYSGFSNDLLMWMSEFYRLKQVLVKCISIIFFLVTEYVFTRLEFIEVDPIRLNEYGFFKTLIDQLINDV